MCLSLVARFYGCRLRPGNMTGIAWGLTPAFSASRYQCRHSRSLCCTNHRHSRRWDGWEGMAVVSLTTCYSSVGAIALLWMQAGCPTATAGVPILSTTIIARWHKRSVVCLGATSSTERPSLNSGCLEVGTTKCACGSTQRPSLLLRYLYIAKKCLNFLSWIYFIIWNPLLPPS